ncbi:MAG: sugar transferase [Prevotella sp.]
MNKTNNNNHHNTGACIRRFFDCIIALICLIVFSPLMLACALVVACVDGLPVIYRQERIGLGGKPFYIYKFRSMCTDAEQDEPALLETEGDSRITRTGHFLRNHHLDELPQLWNVLKGDMAFIGPRPERKYFIDKIMEHDKRYEQLYSIRPGVTSYATLYNGYTDTMEKMLRRLELDLYYLEHRSWWFDTKILFKTFTNIIFGKKF